MTDSTRPSHQQPEPREQVLYEEKLYPSFWLWLIALLFAGLSYMVLAPIGILAGVIAAVGMFVLCAIVLTATTPRIVVTDSMLQVGRAGIERKHLGPVTGYRGEDAVYQRGPGLHGLAFLCLRGWIAPVVRIQVTDERDRTPYWLTSTRRPEQLVTALGGQMFVDLVDEVAQEDDEDDVEARVRRELDESGPSADPRE